MSTDKQYTAFVGFDRLADGDLETVLRRVRDRAGAAGQVLIFDDETGNGWSASPKRLPER
jgi:hypothetical protein